MRATQNNALFLILTLFLGGCATNSGEADKIIRKVKVERVSRADSLELKTFPGLVKEASELNLSFRVGGPIARMVKKEGDYVQAGELIAKLDPRDYEIALQVARAKYSQVKAEADRIIELYHRESVTRNNYDKAVSGLQMAEAQFKHAESQLEDTRLIAPVSGYIQKVNFRENEIVDAGMPVVALMDVDHYVVEFDIPVSLFVRRSEIVSYRGWQPQTGFGEFSLQLLSMKRKANQNQLYRVQLSADPAEIPVVAPGMDVQVQLLIKAPEGEQMHVPLKAIFNEENKSFVWIYDPDTETVLRRKVTAGSLTTGGWVRIEDGLSPDELIVVAGVNLISDGEKVVLLEPVSETNIGGLL